MTAGSLPAVLAADIGGTFTDLVLRLPDGRLAARKVLSTPADYGGGLVAGAVGLLEAEGVAGQAVVEVCHGTTLGTNAVLERRGALTGLITTRGFRDTLEIRRIRFPEPYNVQWEKPAPLVSRRLRAELTERISADGTVLQAPDPEETAGVIKNLLDQGVRSIAVALINSHANPSHERWVAAQIEAADPGCAVSVSAELLPEIGEYERTSTAVANAYLAPIMRGYLRALRSALDQIGLAGPLYVGQSNGGLFVHTFAMDRPYLTLESGPAAGAVAAQRLARRSDYDRLLVVDMGGTTTKASFIADGRVSWASEIEIGSEVSQASRMQNGGGYAVRCPLIDLAEVGAGGGSIAWLDTAGVLHVGPQSAGASPGPACYSGGGTEATLTDANVVLGYLNPTALAGGSFAIQPDRARAAIAQLAGRLGKTVDETAYGIHLIANSNMGLAIRAVSTQRGRDLRAIDMLAFGGAGPVQAVGLAIGLGVRRVIIPPFPGLFSSLGLLIADVEHHLMRGYRRGLEGVDPVEFNAVLADMESAVSQQFQSTGREGEVTIERVAALKLHSRSGEVLVDLPSGSIGAEALAAIGDEFQSAYRALYRHLPNEARAEIVNLRVVGRLARDVDWSSDLRDPHEPDSAGTRQGYFGPEVGFLNSRVVTRSGLAREGVDGPAFIEEADSTTVVHPGWRASLDPHGNIVVEA